MRVFLKIIAGIICFALAIGLFVMGICDTAVFAVNKALNAETVVEAVNSIDIVETFDLGSGNDLAKALVESDVFQDIVSDYVYGAVDYLRGERT